MHLVLLSDFGVLKTYRLRDWCVCECTQIYKSMRSLILIEKVDPENEVLRLKTLDLWRLSEDFESEEIGVTLKTWYSFVEHEREDFCFRSLIFSFLSHRKHRTVKGDRGNTKETDFQLMLISKSYTYPILRVKPLEISYQFSQFLQWQRRRSSGL